MGTTAIPDKADYGLELVVPGRGLAAGAGWDWVARGASLFGRAPLMWIISIVVVFVGGLVISLVPLLGSIAFQLLQAVIGGGFMVACRALEQGGEFDLEHLFAGFARRFVPLLIVGAVMVAGMLLILMVFAGLVGFSIIGALMTGDPEAAMSAILASGLAILLGLLVMLALSVPLLAAYWFAPALVMLHDMAPVAAMKASFFACLRNFVPFLVYGVIMLVAALIAAIPFGLGFLVWIPIAITSTYAAYRDIFTDERAAPPPAMA